jgi:mannose-6-phosphate isomerase-like protein (cupin superfamily)
MRTQTLSHYAARARAIHRRDMVACKLAFIDCKLPGSDRKENYSLIGAGVTQSDDQVVNLTEPHGFSLGIAAMPPGVTNNLHMHFTAEVFMIQRGTWKFRWGHGDGQGEIVGGPGDMLSIPTWIFRGFSNVGADDGWIVTALGGDNTGGIIWHPSILAAAAEHDLYLTRDNMLVDVAAGAPRPAPDALTQPLGAQDLAALPVYGAPQMRERLVRADEREWSGRALMGALVSKGECELAPALGYGISEQRGHAAPIAGAHGFSIDWLRLGAGGATGRFLSRDRQVFCVMRGSVEILINDGPDRVAIRLEPQEVYSAPVDVWRELRSVGDEPCELTVLTAGDHRKRLVWADEVVEAAGAKGFSVDPNGCIVARRLLPLSALDVGVAA